MRNGRNKMKAWSERYWRYVTKDYDM